MALAEIRIQVECDEKLDFRCAACEDTVETDRIALMQRRRPGGEFTLLCVACAKEVCQAAYTTLSITRALEYVLEP